MNALELADDVKNISNAIEALEWVQKAVPILRQQQAEIEALKNRNWDLVSEPWGFDRHLAKPPLTDSEITEVFDKCFPTNASSDVIPLVEFARAILRKAQEK